MNFTIQKYLQTHIPNELITCIDNLEKQCEQGVFTSWSLANNRFAFSAFWADESKISKKNIYQLKNASLHPYFDISSLSKPIFLNLYLRLLFKNDFLKVISTPLNDMFLHTNNYEENENLLKFLLNSDKNFNLNAFLSHYSGAKNWFWMGSAKWLQKQTSHNINEKIYHSLLDKKDNNITKNVKFNLNESCITNLNEDQHSQVIYSDINYYILARIIESYFMKNMSWNDVLNIINEKLLTRFFHVSLNPNESQKAIPFYPYISFYGEDKSLENNFGNISDTNANILSSFGENTNVISGHSGLFGSVCDVKFAVDELCKTQKKYLDLISYVHDKNVRFVYGLDTPTSKETTAALKNWPENRENVYGHLGYSGTSFWFSINEKLKRHSQHILLTNRLASRSKYGVENCPRFYIFTDFSHNLNKIFLRNKNSISLINEMEFFDINQEYYGISKKIWDNTNIRVPPNINEIRRAVGFNLWDI